MPQNSCKKFYKERNEAKDDNRHLWSLHSRDWSRRWQFEAALVWSIYQVPGKPRTYSKALSHTKQNRKEITSLAEKWRLNHYTVFYRQHSALSVMFQTLNLVSHTSETRHGEAHLYSQHSQVEARGSEVYHLWLHDEFDLIYMRPYPCPNPPSSPRGGEGEKKILSSSSIQILRFEQHFLYKPS